MPAFVSFSALRSLAAIALGLLATAACAQTAATELLCGMRAGGVAANLRVPAGDNPLLASSVDVGEGFEVRAVALRDEVGSDRIGKAVVTVLARAGTQRRVVLSQSRLVAMGREALDGQATWRPNLSGWSRVYAPVLGRELACGVDG